MAEIKKIQEGQTAEEVAELLDDNFGEVLSKLEPLRSAIAQNAGEIKSIKSGYATKVELLDYATKEYVDDNFVCGEALVGLASEAWVGDNYAPLADFTLFKMGVNGSLSMIEANYATKEYVDGLALGGEADLSNYYTKTEADGKYLFKNYDLAPFVINSQFEISAGNNVLLTLDTKTADDARIKFAKNGALSGYIGMDGHVPTFWDIEGIVHNILHDGDIVNNLNSESTTSALSAKQGNVIGNALNQLGDRIDGLSGSLGDAAFKGVATNVTNGNNDLVTSGAVYSSIIGYDTDVLSGKYALISQLNNYLPTSGGTINNRLIISSSSDGKLILNETGSDTKYQYIVFQNGGVNYGYLGTLGDDNLKWNSQIIIHSGNIGSQSVKYATSAGNADYATKLANNVTIWGQSFDGSGDVSGNLTGVGSISMSNILNMQDKRVIAIGNGGVLSIRPKDVSVNEYKPTTLQVSSAGVEDGIDWSFGLITQGGSTVNTVGSGVGIVMSGYDKGNSEFQIGRGAGIAAVVENSWYNKTGLAFYTNHNTSSGTVDNFTEKLRLTNGGNLIPKHSTTQTLGNSSNRWSALYAKDIDVDGALTASYLRTTSTSEAALLTGGKTSYNDGKNGIGLLASGTIATTGSAPKIIFYYGNATSGTHYLESLDNNLFRITTYLEVFNSNNSGTTYLQLNKNNNRIYRFENESTGLTYKYGTSTSGVTTKGTFSTSGSYSASSDITKKNVHSYEPRFSVEDIANAPTAYFTWKDLSNNRENLGTIAQYWKMIAPQCVYGQEGIDMTLDYATLGLVSGIINARKIVDHEDRIKALEEENERLRNKLLNYKRRHKYDSRWS